MVKMSCPPRMIAADWKAQCDYPPTAGKMGNYAARSQRVILRLRGIEDIRFAIPAGAHPSNTGIAAA